MSLFLTFSDAAKFADVARNIVNGFGYHNSFAFFLDQSFNGRWISPVTPFLMSLFMKLFGINDFAVILTTFFFFILTLIFVYLLAGRLSGSKIVGFLSALAVGFNSDLLNYSLSGASEIPFIFELVLASYFITLKNKYANMGALLTLPLMYYTRPQAFVYIFGMILYYLILNFEPKKVLKLSLLAIVVGIVVDKLILAPLSGKWFIYSVLSRGANVLSQVAGGESASNQLRSAELTFNYSIIESLKKLFYNFYNFYKLMPLIVNPYLLTLFVLGFFRKGIKEFKIASLVIVISIFIVTGLTIPFFRYVHPIIPFVYIIAIYTLSKFVLNKWFLVMLVLFLSLGQTLGVQLLDTRFKRSIYNVEKPPIYVLLAKNLNRITNKSDVIVTNLDTWGSWYGERKTVWFPLEPKMLEGKDFNAIYLTNYKIDDENYYMSSEWRIIFENPEKQTILPDYTFVAEYKIDPSENYEREDGRAVLLIKNKI